MPALMRTEGKPPWAVAVDGLLLLGVLAWIALRATIAPHPDMLAIYSALLVGGIVHRVFSLMDRPPA